MGRWARCLSPLRPLSRSCWCVLGRTRPCPSLRSRVSRWGPRPASRSVGGPRPSPSPPAPYGRAPRSSGLRSLRSLGRAVCRGALLPLSAAGRRYAPARCEKPQRAPLRFFISLRSGFRLPAAARSACSLASSSNRLRYASPVAADRSVAALRYALVPRACPAGAPRCAQPPLAHAGCVLVTLAGGSFVCFYLSPRVGILYPSGISDARRESLRGLRVVWSYWHFVPPPCGVCIIVSNASVAGALPPAPPAPLGASFHYVWASPSLQAGYT